MTTADLSRVMVTGGAGFIGSALVHHLIDKTEATVLNIDKLTYAGSLRNVADVAEHRRYQFRQIDICDAKSIAAAFAEFRPDAVIHLAAETHVDRSIDSAAAFIQTNIVGTSMLLESALTYWRSIDSAAADRFRFVHVSTDEIYGSLQPGDPPFDETTPFRPNSPYAASKAAADHLVRSWVKTYGFPAVTTNCSNNYGPRQLPEKLIPMVINRALRHLAIPVYGKGENVRDWLFVGDHVEAIWRVANAGAPGRTYNIGGDSEISNLDLVRMLCAILDDRFAGRSRPFDTLITFVTDRPGHDFRYAINHDRLTQELGWKPRQSLRLGLEKTIDWYLANQEWCEERIQEHKVLDRVGTRSR